MTDERSGADLATELEDLRSRLHEAEETLRAIRHGDVDAVLVTGARGEQVYSQRGADSEYRLLVETMSEGAATSTADGVLLYANAHLATLLGRSLDQVIGTVLRNYLPAADQSTFDGILAQAGKQVSRGEISLQASDGQLVPVYLSASCLKSEEPGTEFCLVLTDLTGKKHYEQMVESERLARSILEQAAEAVLVCDQEGVIIRASRVAQSLSEGSPLLRSFAEAFPLRKNTSRSFDLVKVLRGETLRNREVVLDRQGRRFDLILNAGPLRDGEKILGCVVTLTDNTERKQAEEALRQSEILSRSLIEHLPQRIFIKDRNLAYAFCNANFAAALATSPEQIVGKDDFALFPAEFAETYRADDRKVIADGKIKELDERYVAAGEERWAHTVKVPYRDQHGEVIGVLGVFEDITERKRAETQREQLAALLEASPDFIGYADAKTTQIRYINKHGRRMCGIGADEDVGKLKISDVHPAWMNDLFAEVILPAAVRDGLWEGEGAFLHRDGHEIPVSMALLSRRAADGEVDIFYTVSRDITERKRAEVALRTSLEEFRTLAEAMPQIVWITGPDGSNTFFNQHWMDYTGLTLEESLGHGWNKPFHPDDQQRAWVAWQRATAGHAEYSLEARLRRADGVYRWWLVRAKPAFDDSGNVVKWYGTCTDIHDLKMAEQKLLHTSQVLRESERRFSDFLGNVQLVSIMLDVDGRITYCNDYLLQLTGWQREEVLGKNWFDVFVPPELVDLKGTFFAALLANQSETLHHENEIVTRSGARRLIRFNNMVLRSSDGNVTGTASIGEDITEDRTVLKSLFEKEQLLSEAERLGGIGSCLWKMGGPILFSEEMYRIHGVLPDTFTPTVESMLGIMHPDDRPAMESWIGALAAGGQPGESEYRVIMPDGTIRFLLGRGHVARDAGNKTIHVTGTAQDITERKRAEEARRHREAELEESQRIARIGSWEWVLATGVVTWSEGMNHVLARASGSPAPTFDTLSQFYTSDSWERLSAVIARAVETGTPYDLELEMIRADGTTCWTTTRGEAVRGADGTVVKLRGMVLDVTERKRAEESLALLAMAVEQSAESIMITDPTGALQYVNPAFEHVTGYTRTEVMGQNPRFLKSGKQDAEFYRQLWKELTRGRFWTGHLVNKRKDGTLYEVEANISPVRDASGKTLSYVAVDRDVTREVQLESEMRQAQKMEAIGLLAGGVAHDFNNILAVIMLQAELTGMAVNSPESVREGLKEINTAADRAANLTRQLLLFSRRQVMQVRALDLNDVVTNVVKMLQRIVGEDIHLQLDLGQRKLITRADSGMLEQVVMNLVVNARDAMTGGGQIVIATDERTAAAEELASIPGATPGRYVRLRVTDTGGGIPPEHLRHLFEPFFTTKEPGKGTGLGLATVFGIVKQHGGSITVESEVGRGTTFQVLLPASAVTEEVPAVVYSTSELRRGTETILIVEDESAVRTLMHRVLSAHGYRVLDAEDGVDALRVWDQHAGRIDLLLTDLVMPNGIGGRELAARLRERSPELRVVYTSGYSADIAGTELALEEGQAFLQKPSPTEQILVTLRRCLDA